MAKSSFVYCEALVDVPPIKFNAKKLWLTGQMQDFLASHPNALEPSPGPEPEPSGMRAVAACTPAKTRADDDYSGGGLRDWYEPRKCAAWDKSLLCRRVHATSVQQQAIVRTFAASWPHGLPGVCVLPSRCHHALP